MVKIIDLVKRCEALTVAEFHEVWRDRHGLLMAAIPGLRRYVQSHSLLQGYANGELLFDGISEMWFDDEAAWMAARASPEFAAAEREADRITDRTRAVRMPVEVHVIKDGGIPAGAVKNIEFVNRRPGMALEPFRAYWREVHGPIASRIPVLRRYEQNHLARSAYDGAEPPYDGLAITWFASTADMKSGTRTPEYAVTRADEPHFLPDGHLPIIITREHVLKG
jgi:uncharacterized protein (TIGR02118 family)